MKKTADGAEAATKLDTANKIRLGSFYRAALALLAALATPIAEANITVNGTSYSSGVGLNTANGTFTITGSPSGYVQVKQNCTIVLDNVTWTASDKKQDLIQITDGLTVNLQLKGKSTMSYNSKSYVNGIRVTSGSTLNITNITDDAQLIISMTGTQCTAIGGSYNANSSGSACGSVNIYGGSISVSSGDYSAGIGGFKGNGGTIKIYGGAVIAKGGGNSSITSSYGGAGIGGGNNGAGGTVEIYGGTVTASSTKYGAGIGGGYSGNGATVRVYGGTVSATGGDGAAGIGGGRSGNGAVFRIDSGVVTATGGDGGAGIGGGRSGAGGPFYNFGGTVYAKGATSNAASDIGSGYNYSGSSSYLCRITGGSTGLANGTVTGQQSASNDTVRVYRVLVNNCTSGKQYTFDGLPNGYKQTYIVPDSSNVIHLWLPNGAYKFENDDYGYSATVASAKTAATAAKKYAFTFADIDGEGGSVTKKVPTGWALTAPDAPERDGYAFKGWSPEVPSTAPSAAATYTAQWEALRKHTITFDADGGSEVADMEFAFGAAVAGVPEPVKEGYEFAGWSPALPEKMPDEDMSVKATWILAPYFRVDSVVAKRPYGDVEITYSSYRKTLEGDFNFVVSAGGLVVTAKTFKASLDLSEGTHTAVWDAKADLGEKLRATQFAYALTVGSKAEAKYLVLDLADGSKTYLADAPEGGWTDEHKTAKLVLRKIIGEGETATFAMGSPNGEHGREKNETQHDVTLTKPYWMGVFEVTQKQWELVKGEAPDCHTKGDTLPVESVSWNDVKGYQNTFSISETTAQSTTFFGKLQALARGSVSGLNLPTEAEWEYACRAGTATAFSNGTDLKNSSGNANSIPDGFGEIAVWSGNAGGAAAVGTKSPNAWGLYDMHGNVWEWVHDTAESVTTENTTTYPSDYTGNESDPAGKATDYTNVSSYPYHIYRGGSYYNYASALRSASRRAMSRDASNAYTGFRVAARGFAGEATAGAEEKATGAGSVVIGKGGVMVVFR